MSAEETAAAVGAGAGTVAALALVGSLGASANVDNPCVAFV